MDAPTQSSALQNSPDFIQAKKHLLDVIAKHSAQVSEIKKPKTTEAHTDYLARIKKFEADRGRELYYPFLSSGLGSGPFVELEDGSVKLDLITGIGINFFGHTHPVLMDEVLNGVSSDVLQGNLLSGVEAAHLLRKLLSMVGPKSRLTKAWLHCSGTMANETAIKIIRQKKFPATKILAFRDGFHGRSTAMQELTDSPGYRQGQPTFGQVEYLPFFDPGLGLQKSIDQTLKVMREHLTRYPTQFAGLLLEIIQGEGGFCAAPREFYVSVFEEAKKAGLAIWADEVQTFGRTGELFAFQLFDIAEYIDVVTTGKLLQACSVLYTDEFNPKPGLVAGTFTGSAAALRAGKKILDLLEDGGFLGPSGLIQKRSKLFVEKLEKLKSGNCTGKIGEIRAFGGMIGFVPHDGSMESVKKLLFKLYDLGVVAFYCGHGPYLVRMLPPLGVMTEAHIDLAVQKIEEALNQ